MATAHKIETISLEDYLAGEQDGDCRHEYVAGYVYAMTGASEAHNLICTNLVAMLHPHLRGKPCRVFVNDMKVRVGDNFYYPDLMVCCDPSDNAKYFKTDPVLLIEVLSPSTKRTDVLEKRIAYQSLQTLQEYVLVAQDRVGMSIYRRIDNGWELETLAIGDTVFLRSIGLETAIETIYEDIEVL
jgi:Uma2 family endonuclease